MRHNPPNADSPVAQISRITPSALHEQYSTWCEQAREVALPVDSFRPLFYQIKTELQLAMRTSKQGSAKCYICSLIDAVRSGAVGFTEKQFVNTLLIDHVKFHNTETELYEKDCFDAKDAGSGITSISTDGAASQAHPLPKVAGRPPKGMPEWPQKLQGVLMHGKAISLFHLFHGIKSGSNMMLTALLKAMHQENLAPSEVVKIKVDGGSENWNVIVLAFIDLLFDMYPELKEVVISWFGVGHTHNDLDRLFGYINQIVFGISPGGQKKGRDVLTREAFFDLCRDALKTKQDTMLLETRIEDLMFTYDFKSFLEPHIYREFRGHGSSGQIHVFRFQRRHGRAHPHQLQVLAPISDLAARGWVFIASSYHAARLAGRG